MFISSSAEKILKTLHLVAVCCWVGGCFALLLLLYAASNAQSGEELFGVLRSYRFVTVIVTVYMGAYGSFFTGLAYSLCTNRGFFRHKWIILKWILTVGMMIFGANCSGVWSTSLLEMTRGSSIAILHDPVFLSYYGKIKLALIAYNILFLLIILLSVYKPWEKAELLAQHLKG